MSGILLSLKKPLAFTKRDFLISISYRFDFIFQFLGVLFSILTLYFLSSLFGSQPLESISKYGGDYFSYVIIGFSFSSYLAVSLNSLSKSIREAQTTGTLEALLVTQTEIPTIIISSSIYSFLITSVHVLLFLTIGVVFLGIDFSNANYLAAMIIFILTIISFSSLGIISASFIMIMKRGNPVDWLVTGISWLLGGVYYPVSILPDWLQKISYMLPITYSLEGMRMALLKGSSIGELTNSVIALGIFSIIMLPISVLSFRMAIRQAKIHGSLTQY